MRRHDAVRYSPEVQDYTWRREVTKAGSKCYAKSHACKGGAILLALSPCSEAFGGRGVEEILLGLTEKRI